MLIEFITTNDSKVKLANNRLSKYGIQVTKRSLPLYEIQSLDVYLVSKSKSEQAAKQTDRPFIIEDSSLEIKSLKGFPGTLLKPVFEVLSVNKITKLIEKDEDRSATVIGQLIFVDNRNNISVTFQGKYKGKIALKPRGINKRGWAVSEIFIPEGSKKTIAEMNDSEWHKFLKDFRKNDQYEKFGRWFIKNK